MIEVLIAIAIVILIATVSLSTIRIGSSSSELRSACGKIENLLDSARRRAAMTGKRTRVVFDPEDNSFAISDHDENSDEDGNPEKPTEKPAWRATAPSSVSLPGVSIEEFETASGKNVWSQNGKNEPLTFEFFPDGSAAGPSLSVSVGNISSVVSVSRLTGMVTVESENDGE